MKKTREQTLVFLRGSGLFVNGNFPFTAATFSSELQRGNGGRVKFEARMGNGAVTAQCLEKETFNDSLVSRRRARVESVFPVRSLMVPEAQRLESKLRFDVYEADPRSGELRKRGIRIPLEDRPFRALLILLSHANDLVTREELQKRLWPSDIFIDFDHGLNTAIRKIRRALNDDAGEPRFIETVGGRGYRFLVRVEQEPVVAPHQAANETPVPKPFIVPQDAQEAAPVAVELAPPEIKRTYSVGPRAILAIAASAILLFLAYLFRPAMPSPRIGRVVQLTKTGGALPGGPLYTDGPRIYYRSIDEKASEPSIRQVLLNGNEDTPVGIPGRLLVRGLSPDDTEFLATSPIGVWRVPIASNGSPRRVGNLLVDDIAWSHDGTRFAYSQGNQLFLANLDG